MPKNNDAKLKSCPFCGSQDIHEGGGIENGSPLSHWVFCGNCYAETDSFDTREGSIKAWNTRRKLED